MLSAQPLPADSHLLNMAESAFSEANELLNTDPVKAKAAYNTAVDYYSSIIESGTRNAALYYNLGNSYIRLGRVGYAVLNYRKALLYSPGDRQIKYNLEYARSLQKNEFPASTENEVLHILLFWHYLTPSVWKIIIAAAANAVFWTALVLRRFGRTANRIAAASLVLLLVFGTSLLIELRNSKEIHGVVISESATGRLGDSLSYESAFDAPLYEGAEFTVKQRRVGWILAEMPDGGLAWLQKGDCGIIEEPSGN